MNNPVRPALYGCMLVSPLVVEKGNFFDCLNIKTGRIREMPQFDEVNQPKKRRGKSGRTLVLEGIMAAIPDIDTPDKAQSEFFKMVSKRAFCEDDKDSAMLAKWLGDKGYANLKPVMEKVSFDFDESGTPFEQAAQVLKAASEGYISPDIAQMFVSSINGLVKIEEVTEIRKELEELKELVAKMNG